MSSPQFDPEKFTATAREQWNKAADDWHKWINIFADWITAPTEEMFDLANIGTGHHVLDVAAGDGSQSMMAAKRVGNEGYVLATDLSANLVEIIKKNASAAGLANLEAREMNAENLEALKDNSFDIAISRLGLMLFANPSQSLKEIYRVLKPGGRKAALVFTTPDKSLCFSGPAMIAIRHAGAPPPRPGQPGLFALGAHGLLEKKFQEAGFQNVETRIVSAPVKLDAARDFRKFLEEAGGFYRAVLSKLDTPAQQAAWDEMEEYLKQFETDEGFDAPCELIMVVGTK